MDKEFSHGSNDGAFIGFSSGAKAIDIGLYVRIVYCGALCAHIEAFADLGASSFDSSFTFVFAAVAVVWSDPS